jgi:hypothetical protein
VSTIACLYRFGNHFELQLVAQSIVMIIAMWILIHVSVNATRRHILPPYKGVSVWSTFGWSGCFVSGDYWDTDCWKISPNTLK